MGKLGWSSLQPVRAVFSGRPRPTEPVPLDAGVLSTIRLSPHGTYFADFEDIVVNFRHDGPLPTPAFEEWLEALRRKGVTGFLSCAVGPVQMSSTQRREAAQLAEQLSLRTLVVTDDRIGRGIVTAVSWLGANIRAASWASIAEAAAFLGKDPRSGAILASLAWELRRRTFQMIPRASEG